MKRLVRNLLVLLVMLQIRMEYDFAYPYLQYQDGHWQMLSRW